MLVLCHIAQKVYVFSEVSWRAAGAASIRRRRDAERSPSAIRTRTASQNHLQKHRRNRTWDSPFSPHLSKHTHTSTVCQLGPQLGVHWAWPEQLLWWVRGVAVTQCFFSVYMLKWLFVCFSAGNTIFATVLLPQSSKCEVLIFLKQISLALCDRLDCKTVFSLCQSFSLCRVAVYTIWLTISKWNPLHYLPAGKIPLQRPRWLA